MNKYIDINELGIGRADPKIFNNPEYANGWNSAIEIIEKATASEVVEVVRCKNCKYYHQKQGWCDKHSYFYDDDRNSCRPEDSPDWTMFLDNDFCSYGERR